MRSSFRDATRAPAANEQRQPDDGEHDLPQRDAKHSGIGHHSGKNCSGDRTEYQVPHGVQDAEASARGSTPRIDASMI